MRIRQYVYFALRSDVMDAAEIASMLSLAPDRSVIRGSRTTSPPRPKLNAWHIVCDDPGLRVDQQIARVVERLQGVRGAIAELASGGSGVTATLQVVRELDLGSGEEEEPEVVAGFVKLSGQHQLLGWRLGTDAIQFLYDVGAQLDVDEYG